MGQALGQSLPSLTHSLSQPATCFCIAHLDQSHTDLLAIAGGCFCAVVTVLGTWDRGGSVCQTQTLCCLIICRKLSAIPTLKTWAQLFASMHKSRSSFNCNISCCYNVAADEKCYSEPWSSFLNPPASSVLFCITHDFSRNPHGKGSY